MFLRIYLHIYLTVMLKTALFIKPNLKCFSYLVDSLCGLMMVIFSNLSLQKVGHFIMKFNSVL